MPPKKSLKRAAGGEYDADGGFVEAAPKSKKTKAATTQPANLDVQKDDDGNDFWQISGKRRLTVNDFKGNTMINIREYYEKDGKTLPGKGVALNVDQYKAFIELLPQIELSLSTKGIQVPRPQYDRHSSAKSVKEKDVSATKAQYDDDDDDEEPIKPSTSVSKHDDNDEEPDKPSTSVSKLAKFKLKPNHEATSDEDEG